MKRKSIIMLLFLCCTWFSQAGVPYLKTSNTLVCDTMHTLMQNFNQKETRRYLDSCQARGCNAVIMSALNSLTEVNVYGDKALKNSDITKPHVTNGNNFADYLQYDYWDNVEWVVDELARRKMYAVLTPIAGRLLAENNFPRSKIRIYMNLLARRMAKRSNVIWHFGTDLTEDEFDEARTLLLAAWREMAEAVKVYNTKQLIIFRWKEN